jgi:peptide/nickel transport system substrate-binding protein
MRNKSVMLSKPIVRRDALKSVLVGTAAISLGLGPLGVAAQSSAGKTLTAAILGSMEHLHPWHLINHDVGVLKNLLYSNLVRAMPDNSIVPEVAKSLPTVSDDGLVYTFELRNDVRFHNGDLLTADDVLYSYEKFLETARRRGEFKLFLESVHKEGDFKVRFKLHRPWSGWLLYLTKYMALVRKGTDLKALFRGPGGSGSGPYMLKSFKADVEAVLEAFPDYFGGTPRQKTIRIVRIPDAATQLANLIAGDVDIISNCPPKDYKGMIGKPGYAGGAIPSAGIFYGVLNRRKPPFDNVYLRRAVSNAIDRDFICNDVYHGLVTPTSIPAAPTDYWYDKKAADMVAYDPDRAKFNLKEAGKSNGFEFEATIPVPSAYIEAKEAAVVIQANLAEVGIKMKLRQVDFSSMFKLARKLDYVSYWFPSMQPAIEDYLLALSYMCDARKFMSLPCNPTYDEEITAAYKYIEPNKRKPHFVRATRILAHNATNVWIGRLNTYHVWKDKVHNFGPAYQYTMELRDAYIS